VDAGLENIVLTCLAKEPANRYATAVALADDLRRWLNDEVPKARKPGWPARAWKKVRRHPWVSTAVAALFFLAVGLGAGYVLIRSNAPPTPDQIAANALEELRRGRPVTWIPEKGPPINYQLRVGAAETLCGTKADEPFSVDTFGFGQLDLIPNPPNARYMVRCLVRQNENQNDAGEVGLTLGHRSVQTVGGMYHCFLRLLVSEPINAEARPRVALTVIYFKEGGPILAFGNAEMGVGITLPRFQPAVAAAVGPAATRLPAPREWPKPPWRQLEVQVSPETIRVACDDRRVGDITWEKLDQRTSLQLGDTAPPGLVNPPFGPGEPLGLFVYRGSGSFCSFVVTPLPQGP
jgi:serine/threonine-protein kinase